MPVRACGLLRGCVRRQIHARILCVCDCDIKNMCRDDISNLFKDALQDKLKKHCLVRDAVSEPGVDPAKPGVDPLKPGVDSPNPGC